MSRGRVLLRPSVMCILVVLLVSPAQATNWVPREDVGVAAVDTRTGKVLWEAWRPDEVPASASKEEKTAVDYLLAAVEDPKKPLPPLALLPDFPVKHLALKNPSPPGWDMPGPYASRGKTLIYYRHSGGVVALDRATGKELWRLATTREPYPSLVLEAGENRAFIQIGSDVPTTIHTILTGIRSEMMRNLEPHTPRQRAAAAVLLRHYGDGYLRPELRKLAEGLRKEKDEPAAEEAARAGEQLLADWPQTRDRRRLLDGCIAALLKEDGDPFHDFAWPGTDRMLTWCLLQELIYGRPHDAHTRQGFNYAYDGWEERPVSLPDATKAKLADHSRKVVAGGPDAEKPFAASVLVSTAVGWSLLTDAERKTLFLSQNPSAWRWASMALARNGRRKELVEWVNERPANEHLDVIFVLAHNPPKEWSEQELAFWLAVARRNPASVAYVLRLTGRPVPIEFREPILAYLKREIARPAVKNTGTQPAYDLHAALVVLDGWKNPVDTPLLLEYLKHPAHHAATRINGDVMTELRVYGLRGHIRNMLEARGATVPDGTVYQEEGEPTKE